MTCPRCGASYDWAAWQALELVGPVDPEFFDRDDVVVEQRNCKCGTTLTATTECTTCAWLAKPWEQRRDEPTPRCSPECECLCHE